MEIKTMKNISLKKRIKKGDLIVFLFAAIAVAISFLLPQITSQNGSYAVVSVNSKTQAVLPLESDTVYDVKINSQTTNVVEIKNGSVSITQANCPDKLCKNHKKINKTGECIVCLPNKVTVTIENKSGNDEIDGVAV